MQSDGFTRAVLSAIAILLLLLVVRSFAPGESRDDTAMGRYQLQNVRIGRATTVLKIDSQGGDVWRLHGRPEDVSWELLDRFDEPREPGEAGEEEISEMPEAPAAPARPGAQLSPEARERLLEGRLPAGRPAQQPPRPTAAPAEAPPGPPGGEETP